MSESCHESMFTVSQLMRNDTESVSLALCWKGACTPLQLCQLEVRIWCFITAPVTLLNPEGVCLVRQVDHQFYHTSVWKAWVTSVYVLYLGLERLAGQPGPLGRAGRLTQPRAEPESQLGPQEVQQCLLRAFAQAHHHCHCTQMLLWVLLQSEQPVATASQKCPILAEKQFTSTMQLTENSSSK